MTPDLDLLTWAAEQASAKRDAILEAHEEKEPTFVEKARDFVLNYLRDHDPASGEWLTDRCKAAGIRPDSSDDRAFGAVFGGLSRKGLIVRDGHCLRDKGHSTSGGIIWRLAA